MLCKVLRTGGAIFGWVGAIANEVVVEGHFGICSLEVTMICLSLAIVATLAIVVNCYTRPLGQAFDLGYEAGRRDAIKEATKRTGVRQLKPFPLDLEPIRGRRDREPAGR